MKLGGEAGSDGRPVLVTGAAGFVGRATVRLLLDRGDSVRALVRSPDAPLDPRAEVLVADVRDAEALGRALDGAGAIVHLAARKGDQPDSYEVNAGGARNLVAAARTRNVRRIVNVSTQATTYARRDRYGESKRRGDEIFAASGLDVVTLIPSLVYGDDTTGVFARIVDYVRALPVIPILGSGKAVFQPIHVDDLARVIVAALDAPAPRPVYEVGGPDAVTFDQMVDEVQRRLGTRKPKLHLPWSLCLLGAWGLRALTKRPPITMSNVLGSSSRNTDLLDLGPMHADLGVEPMRFAEGLTAALASL